MRTAALLVLLAAPAAAQETDQTKVTTFAIANHDVPTGTLTFTWKPPPQTIIFIFSLFEFEIRTSNEVIDTQAKWDLAIPLPPNTPYLGTATQHDAVKTLSLPPSSQHHFVLRGRYTYPGSPNQGAWSGLSNPVMINTDDIPPGPISALDVYSPTPYLLRLQWPETWDDGETGGKVSGYEVGISASPILTLAQFEAASKHPTPPIPFAPIGSVLQAEFGGLTPATTYHVAVRAYDDNGNFGDFKAAQGLTLPPDPVNHAAGDGCSGSAAGGGTGWALVLAAVLLRRTL